LLVPQRSDQRLDCSCIASVGELIYCFAAFCGRLAPDSLEQAPHVVFLLRFFGATLLSKPTGSGRLDADRKGKCERQN
jgi:hypothetical protein